MSGIRPSALPRARSGGAISLLGDFQRACLLTGNRFHARRTSSTVRRFLWAEGIDGAQTLTGAAISRHLAGLAEKGASQKTVLNHRTAISAFCRFLCEAGLLTDNPCSRVRVATPEERLPHYLDEAEVQAVLAIARKRGIWPEVCLALSTGLRLGELIRLQWPDIDFARRVLTVRISKGKRPRTIPLSRPALIALRLQRRRSGGLDWVFPARQTWPGGHRFVNRPRAANWWGRALRPIQAAVPKFQAIARGSTGRGWHLFRHTFASRVAQRGGAVSLWTLSAWLGHRDVRTTAIYAHLQAGYDEAIELSAPVTHRVPPPCSPGPSPAAPES